MLYLKSGLSGSAQDGSITTHGIARKGPILPCGAAEDRAQEPVAKEFPRSHSQRLFVAPHPQAFRVSDVRFDLPEGRA
jgi:hypothetical protein